MKFIEGLKTCKPIIQEYALFLSTCDKPILLYGAGVWAKQQYRMLEALGVQFSAITVDEKYLPVADFEGFSVVSLSAALENYPGAIVWLGFNLDTQSFEKVKSQMLLTSKGLVDDIYACDSAQYGSFANHNYSYAMIKDHSEEFDWLYQRLSDEKSKLAMLSYFNQRISGDYKYCEIGYDPNHYFAKDIVTLSSKEVFIDCGAFVGDTIDSLIAIQKPKKVFAFEPENKNFQKLCKKYGNDSSIVCLNKGAYNSETTLCFSSGIADASKISQNGNTQIEVTTIDSLMQCYDSSATFIKMDIEGAELAALQGAERTIKNNHPKLAISVYHKFEDLLQIPQYIAKLDSSYKFYLRRHSHLVHELVLYAI